MATIRAYTTIEQSKKLAEILPLESADMYYPWYIEDDGDTIESGHRITTPNVGNFTTRKINKMILPCWSLAALLGVLPNNEHITTTLSRGSWQIEPIKYLPNTWWCEYEEYESLTEFNVSADNPVDACVAMVEKLHELNLL